jgi:Ca2+-binding EF-hand superfamily protein
MNRTRALLLSTALIAAAPVWAQSIGDWDGDGNGTVDLEEWTTGMGVLGLFSDWDAEADGTLVESEFASGLFERFDGNDDEALSSSEWDDGIDAWYGEEAVELDFEAWNRDDDDRLSEEEFTDSFAVSELYEDFAAEVGIENPNGGIGEDAFVGGLFDWFDADDDGEVSPGESGWFG